MSRILPYYEGSVTMWFKNLMSYRLTKPLDWDLNELQRQLSDCEFHPCGSQDQSKFGWTNPLKGSELLHFSVGKHILLVAKKEEKMLPANVVKRNLQFRSKFPQLLFCFWRQILRNLHLYCCILVTMYRRILHGDDTLSAES